MIEARKRMMNFVVPLSPLNPGIMAVGLLIITYDESNTWYCIIK
jgi:hypothetical protein